MSLLLTTPDRKHVKRGRVSPQFARGESCRGNAGASPSSSNRDFHDRGVRIAGLVEFSLDTIGQCFACFLQSSSTSSSDLTTTRPSVIFQPQKVHEVGLFAAAISPPMLASRPDIDGTASHTDRSVPTALPRKKPSHQGRRLSPPAWRVRVEVRREAAAAVRSEQGSTRFS